ncbi:hypothetical protein J6590_031973 [Homalodisca vitripennis]|nr:hypothetical protein J6590_031973 [Homalodisca vitripennis]
MIYSDNDDQKRLARIGSQRPTRRVDNNGALLHCCVGTIPRRVASQFLIITMVEITQLQGREAFRAARITNLFGNWFDNDDQKRLARIGSQRPTRRVDNNGALLHCCVGTIPWRVASQFLIITMVEFTLLQGREPFGAARITDLFDN